LTTAEFISYLTQRIGGNTLNRTQILSLVNAKQNELLGRDIRMMRILPDPCIHTTAGTYSYAASSAIFDSIVGVTQYDVRNVRKVYTTTLRNVQQFQYQGTIRTTHFPEYLENAYNSDTVIIPVDCTQSIAAASGDCRIRFWRENDPGTLANNTLLCEAYKWPTQLTAESVALSVPDQFQTGLLKTMVMIDIEEAEYGYASPQLYDVKEKQLKQFLAYANNGASTEQNIVRPREL
jgi:hypothetical protein